MCGVYTGAVLSGAFLLQTVVSPAYAAAPAMESTTLTLFYGSGEVQSGTFSLVEKKKTGLSWHRSSFRTDRTDSLRITDLNSGVWSLLPGTRFDILDTKEDVDENPFKRSGRLVSGVMRLKAAGDAAVRGQGPNQNLILETAELRAFVPQGGDIIVTRQSKSAKGPIETTIFSLNGTAFIQILKQKNQTGTAPAASEPLPLNPGMVFAVRDDGAIQPTTTVDNTKSQRLLAFTTTKDEQEAQKHYADGYTVEALVEKCKELEQSQDYFELFNLFDGFRNNYQNNAYVPYCLGIATEGLNQKENAVPFFQGAVKLDAHFTDAYWHLAQTALQAKQYALAREAFTKAHELLSPTDPRFVQYRYYLAVIDFFQNKPLQAKEGFTACSWDDALEPALKQSASEFLAKITTAKPWSVVVPLGATYDNNILSLTRSESLPSTYSSRATWKSFVGEISEYDTSLPSKDLGWFAGAGSKIYYVRNLNATYRSLDALVVEATVFETKRTQTKKTSPSTFRLYQTNGLIYLGSLQNTYYFLTGAKSGVFDFNGGLQLDISQLDASQKTTNMVFNQYYADNYGKWGSYLLSLTSQLQETLAKNRTATTGHAFELIASPSLTYPYSQRFNGSFTPTIDFVWTRADSITSKYKIQPTVAANYFFHSWLMGTFSGTYETDLVFPGQSVVTRPQATVSFTGIF